MPGYMNGFIDNHTEDIYTDRLTSLVIQKNAIACDVILIMFQHIYMYVHLSNDHLLEDITKTV